MQTSSWITMIAVMAVVWGGFASLLVLALRKDAQKRRKNAA